MEKTEKKRWYLKGEETEGGDFEVNVYDYKTKKYFATAYSLIEKTGKIKRIENLDMIFVSGGYDIDGIKFDTNGKIAID